MVEKAMKLRKLYLKARRLTGAFLRFMDQRDIHILEFQYKDLMTQDLRVKRNTEK